MSLKTLIDLAIDYENKKQGLSPERLDAQLDNIRYLISFYR
jgi:hypothetical protein